MAPKRAIRVANCSGAASDPGVHMYNQATYGDVDVITGDYLAEMNIASHAVSIKQGGTGYASTALDGIKQSLAVINEKRIKVIINGGGLNPIGLAKEVDKLVKERGYNLVVAYVEGDCLMNKVNDLLKPTEGKLPHLDSNNPDVHLESNATSFIGDPKRPIVSANAYLGIRAITAGLRESADIIICGRVSDASPVIAAAQWWHGWDDTAYDELAGSLLAGHLIECSTYVTGANFAGFDQYEIPELLDLGLPITEIESDGTCVVTKHEKLGGFVTADTVKCQLVYEIQGNLYLNSDVKADISKVHVEEIATNRVRVTGVKGHPPPPTTKLAVFYEGGYQCEYTMNATGYAVSKKFDLHEAQVRSKLEEWGVLDDFQILDFQRIGVVQTNPQNQLEATGTSRLFAQALEASTLGKLAAAQGFNGMQHFSGAHCSLDRRTMAPMPYLAYFPALVAQSEIDESINIFRDGEVQKISVGLPTKTEPLQARDNYETTNPVDLAQFGPTKDAPLGDIALARSGDKGANINLGVFVHTAEEWDWLRTFLTAKKLQQLMGTDWKDSFFIERVEFAGIKAVHFVIYGPLGRGVSSSRLLDGLGKGFADFIRYLHVPIPVKFLKS
ncbi:hypothetical protein N7520_010645 [Penicillium odoratum]|uniref:uncharacterized protein n=1 Tax=Penicillium odoratum TaxID=1167516 RepID=UPI0025490E28|nr:uncharacterized protein N7520_010645 [Penicillium odoratum]KAJ5745463.1 hypothetical protein N7520_010645 [Penicillium odoratum]